VLAVGQVRMRMRMMISSRVPTPMAMVRSLSSGS
jgi:hypothetical protein